MSLVEVWARYIQRENKMAWDAVLLSDLINNPAEQRAIPGGNMKEVVLKKYHEKMDAAQDEALGGIYDEAEAIGVEKGKSEAGTFTQADIDAAKKEGFDAAVATDSTPISKEEYDAKVAEMQSAIEAVKADDSADKAKIDELVEKWNKLVDFVNGLKAEPVPAPVEQAPAEVPQESTGTPAQP